MLRGSQPSPGNTAVSHERRTRQSDRQDALDKGESGDEWEEEADEGEEEEEKEEGDLGWPTRVLLHLLLRAPQFNGAVGTLVEYTMSRASATR